MRSIYLAAGAVGLLGLFAACGGDDKPNVIDEGPPGISGKTGAGGKSGGGGKDAQGGEGGSGEPVTDPLAPKVVITSPSESATPDDGVLVEQTVTVLCSVSPSEAPDAGEVDPTSVKISMTDAAGTVVGPVAAAATKNDGEYSANLVIATAKSGEVTFDCTANDQNQVKGSDKLSTFVDRGPLITIISPEPESAHPLKGGLAVEFTVEPSPLTESDSGADVGKVTFSLDGKECVVGEKKCQVVEVASGRFKASLALDNTNDFPAPPSGAISITASNTRAPTPVIATTSYNIIVDGVGPGITIESPSPQKVVGGRVTLAFTVTDVGSGVDPDSVNVALFSGAKLTYFDPDKGWTRAGDKYTYSFDTKSIEQDAPFQTTINVRASDRAGNPSASGQSLQLYLDNVPPAIDIDPRNVRVRSGSNCSGSFDPVGTGTVDDLDGVQGKDIVNPVAMFRVFVHERTNSAPGQTLFYHAGTNQAEVRLYVQSDPSGAATKLLINKNPEVDNVCDDIGGLEDLANPPPFTALKPLAQSNSPWNQADPDAEPAAGGECTLKSDPQPQRLCPSHASDMWYVPYNSPIKEPFVYVVGTPVSNDDSCAGIDLAFLTTNQPDGWVCAAARVVDNAGNVGISPPIRVCVDDGKGATPLCRTSSTIPPTCTDGCVPPGRGGGYLIPG